MPANSPSIVRPFRRTGQWSTAFRPFVMTLSITMEVTVAAGATINNGGAVAPGQAADERAVGQPARLVFQPARRFGGGGGALGSYTNRQALGITYERLPVNVTVENFNNPAGIDFQDADMKVAMAQANGLHKFGIISYNGNGTWPPATNLGPVVARYVERYDGDGVDDMPGLTIPIQQWEIFNEYTTNWPGYAGCSEAMYALYLSNAYTWAHAANTGITIVASAVATSRNSRNRWYLTKFLTNTWVTNYFDAMNYHAYEDFYPFTNGAGAQADYLFIRDFMDFLAGYGLTNRDLWATETDFSGTYMNEGQTANQTDNARYLARSYPFALACGVDHIFFTELEYNSHFPAHLNWAVLTDSSGNRRANFYVYQKIIQKLEGYTSASLEDYGNGNLAACFIVGSQPVRVVWNCSNRLSQAQIPLGAYAQARITQALPASFDNTSATWTITTNAAAGGYVTVDTSSNAVYVEGCSSSPTLPAPQNVAASAGTYADRVALSWNAVTGATGYAVWRSISAATNSASVLSATPDSSYADTSAANGILYYYWVQATNALATSAFSSSATGWLGIIRSLAADFDGDGRADPAVYLNGNWHIWMSSQGYVEAGPFPFGYATGIPVAADYDGDNRADPAVVLGTDWVVWMSNQGYGEAGPFTFGQADWTPLAGDFDGDRKADPARYGATNGQWYIWMSVQGYAQTGPFPFGTAGFLPVAADFDGDQQADPAVYDPAGYWHLWMSGSGYAHAGPFLFGASGYMPVAADYDHDGKADPAVTASGIWYVWLSSQGYQITGPFTFIQE